MNVQITFKNTESSQIMEEHARKQMEKIFHLLKREPTPIFIELICEPSKVHAHNRVEFVIKSPHYSLHVHKEGPHIYQIVDEAIDVMYEQLRKEKQKHVDERKHNDVRGKW